MKWFEPNYVGEGYSATFIFKRWDLPGEWLPMHYFEAVNCLFRIENALRLLVYIVLKSHFGEKWTDVALSTEDAQSTSIGAIARKRTANDQKCAYLGEPLTCPLMYLTAGELVGLILSEAYWKLFKRYFPGASNVMQIKLQEIAFIRNALAHFRPVTPEQVSIVKQNGTQILKKFQLEFDELVFAYSSAKLRPWRSSLQVQGIPEPVSLRCSARISKSERWVFFNLAADAQVLKVDTDDETCRIRLRCLDLDKFLRAFPNVRSRCVIATEESSAPRWDGDSDLPPIRKTIRLAFPNISVRSKLPQLATDLLPAELRSHAAHELAAPLDLFSIRTITASETKSDQHPSYWVLHGHETIEHAAPSKFVENWKSIHNTMAEGDTLTALHKYPWMNTQISEPC
jgi:hypothetical protein